ncbi:MAG: glutathione S-transferase family protein [Rhodospirillum sp.]|nr:glutathione S-transferase family protein [Rhodospirillum sp.]MCF8491543.1 glutathione S-transferase family protein [Rhodospirillum sp.]MCF8501562.1 glutathione S-transferase family protein [Rhodospirillum sp.]
MASLTLVIGNRNYSSWSMRPWFALKAAGIPFEDVVIPLFEEGYKARIAAHSPSARVPCLIHGEIVVWESLAILEYLAETFPEAELWPTDPKARAHARAAASEMHGGFQPLRAALPMNLRTRVPGQGQTPEVLADVERIEAIWAGCKAASGQDGPFLFGDRPNAVDAMYAPIITRFRTYATPLNPDSQAYVEAILATPALTEWDKLAKEEPWVIDLYEAGPTKG